MKYVFLHKGDSGRLIIIFSGWSTYPDFYRHINVEGWDLLVIYGYTDFDFPLHVLDSYHSVVIFAWSLGVYMASKTLPADKIALAVAVNGTEYPVDDNYGIPENIFQATAENLSPRNLMKFRRRMCGKAYDTLSEEFSTVPDDMEDLRTQLEFISSNAIASQRPGSSELAGTSSGNVTSLSAPSQNHAPFSGSGFHPGASSVRWHRVYISEQDSIFPPESQQRAWELHPAQPEIIRIPAPHYVDLQRIIASAIPAKEKVGKRFHKALATYDNQAIAQRAIARRLADFPGGVPFKPDKVLEIGPGTGIFTKLFAHRFHPRRIDYIDLYPLPTFEMASEENYFTADAEDWTAERAKDRSGNPHLHDDVRYDAIISASALQWFANPEAFFRNAVSILRPGGFLLCSTFLPGNLVEMKTVNPYGLIYRSAEEMEKLIRKYFLFAKLEEEELILDFKSPLETLRHLKDTGVGGGLDTGLSPRSLLDSIPLRLSYRPLYIYAVKASEHKPPLPSDADSGR